MFREAGTVDWTLELSEPRRKSKIGKPEQRIGRYSSVSHGGSPKPESQSSELDVRAA